MRNTEEIQQGLENLIANENAPQEATHKRKAGRPRKQGSEQWMNKTYTISREQVRKIRAIASQEGQPLKVVLYQLLLVGIEKYENKKGKIILDKRQKGANKSIFDI